MILKHLLLTVLILFFTGCTKEANLTILNPQITYNQSFEDKKISVYDSKNDLVTFYHFYTKEGKLMEDVWSYLLPFRVEFMDMWMTGLGHDLRRLTANNAETIKDALLYAAKEQGMVSLHVGMDDYIIENKFAEEIVDAIKMYEERMKRYERRRDFPLLLR